MTSDNLIAQTLVVTGWSQEALAERIGMEGERRRQTVNSWVKGKHQPRSGVYADLVRALIEQQAEVDALIEALKAAGTD